MAAGERAPGEGVAAADAPRAVDVGVAGVPATIGRVLELGAVAAVGATVGRVLELGAVAAVGETAPGVWRAAVVVGPAPADYVGEADAALAATGEVKTIAGTLGETVATGVETVACGDTFPEETTITDVAVRGGEGRTISEPHPTTISSATAATNGNPSRRARKAAATNEGRDITRS